MKKILNCWEFKQCGREPGGNKTSELGICPASTEKSLDGFHHGDMAGRACWVIAGTFCAGEIQGDSAQKTGNCSKCEFFKKVLEEEGSTLEESIHMLEALDKVTR